MYLPGVHQHRVKQADKHHQTGKPTELMKALIEFCQPGGTVFDPFMGSGTTGVAAVSTNRPFIGCELTTEYFDISCKRIEETLKND